MGARINACLEKKRLRDEQRALVRELEVERENSERHGLEKIKTIGDAYMAAGGLQTPREDHVPAMAAMALAMRDAAAGFRRSDGAPLRLRIGIHAGPVVAGVIGIRKFIYDLWGDTVNIASRMESQGLPGEIQVTAAVHARLRRHFQFVERGSVDIKGLGPITTFLLRGRNTD